MLTLYGSTTSPYVRRLRIWLTDVEHQFINMQIFEGKDREELIRRNPTLKVPMIDDDGQAVYDSRVIFRYLSGKFDYPALSWELENQLTLIDAANDSMVQMLMLSRSGIDVSADKMYFNIQRERAGEIFTVLDKMLQQGEFSRWDYPAICLYSLVDWVEFRDLYDLSGYQALQGFKAAHQQRAEVMATDPRD